VKAKTMSKTLSGFMLVGGIILAVICAPFVDSWDQVASFWINLRSMIAIGGVMSGVAMFFIGSMFFSRK
jgi:hypothetical protein